MSRESCKEAMLALARAHQTETAANLAEAHGVNRSYPHYVNRKLCLKVLARGEWRRKGAWRRHSLRVVGMTSVRATVPPEYTLTVSRAVSACGKTS